ncbi:MAG: putative quinol monooxygenase [Negativicutes bacterium]
MVVVISKLTVKPEKKQELLAAAKELIAATREEAGCISYSLLDDPYKNDRCIFVEEWRDKEALEHHFTTSHIAKWRQESKELLAAKSDLSIYQADKITL